MVKMKEVYILIVRQADMSFDTKGAIITDDFNKANRMALEIALKSGEVAFLVKCEVLKMLPSPLSP